MSKSSIFRIDLALRKTIGTRSVHPRDVLLIDGPRLSVTVGLHVLVGKMRTEKGLVLPLPVTGLAMIDTGATVTTLHMSVAKALGLTPTGAVAGHGIGGTTQGFAASCSITMRDQVVSLLRAHCLDVPALINNNLIALIGRDILRDLVLHYDGVNGTAYLERPDPSARPTKHGRRR